MSGRGSSKSQTWQGNLARHGERCCLMESAAQVSRQDGACPWGNITFRAPASPLRASCSHTRTHRQPITRRATHHHDEPRAPCSQTHTTARRRLTPPGSSSISHAEGASATASPPGENPDERRPAPPSHPQRLDTAPGPGVSTPRSSPPPRGRRPSLALCTTRCTRSSRQPCPRTAGTRRTRGTCDTLR